MDEMLAICSEIDAWREKKRSQDAQARYNARLFYGSPVSEDSDGDDE